MRRWIVWAVLSVAMAAGAVGAQDSRLRAERTVDYRAGRALGVNATVGPVHVSTIEFSDLGRAYGQARIVGIRVGPDSEASTTLRARILAENPTTDEWAVTFGIELLDKDGAVIEKITKRSTWEGESKPYEIEHPLLSYVVPLIAKVRITMEAKLD